MNVPIWLLVIAPPVIFCLGFFIAAAVAVGKASDNADWEAVAINQAARAAQSDEAHARCADSRNTLLARIDRALACETPKAAHGVRKMAAILRGEL